MKKQSWIGLTMAVALVGCAAQDDAGDDGAGDDSVGDDGGDDGVEPPQPELAEAYALTSELDVSAATVLPAPLHDAIELLRGFEASPGTALLDLATLAGVPAVEEIRDALPSALESRLIGWIDDRLEATPVPALAGEIAALADTAFAEVELASTLDLAAGVHALDAIAVEVDGHRAELAVESPGGDVAALVADVDVTVTGAGAELAIGEHRFGLRVGTAAWQALGAAIEARYGADLATVIADAVDCPALADAIADKCILSQCIGHRDELLEVCTGAVGYAVAQLEAQIVGVDFDAVILHAGAATATGAALQRLDGTWTAELDLGSGPRPVPATFTGLATTSW
jgi:hypothetical protein